MDCVGDHDNVYQFVPRYLAKNECVIKDGQVHGSKHHISLINKYIWDMRRNLEKLSRGEK